MQEVKMTKIEELNMYMKLSKTELCNMIIEANKYFKNKPILIDNNCGFYVSGNDTSGNCIHCKKQKHFH